MHRCIHPSFTYSFIFLFNVCCRNSISSTLTFDDATSKIRFSSIKTILPRSFCADSFICLVVFVCKKAHHTHTQHQSITTSQHHTRYYIHTNCHSAAKTVVIINDRLVFFFFCFLAVANVIYTCPRNAGGDMYCHEASPTDIASPQLLAHFMLPDASFSSYFCFVLYMRSYWRERCVKPNFIITDILSARIFAVLLNALSLFLVVVSFLYALASVDKMHEMCFHGNNGTEMNVKKKNKNNKRKELCLQLRASSRCHRFLCRNRDRRIAIAKVVHTFHCWY